MSSTHNNISSQMQSFTHKDGVQLCSEQALFHIQADGVWQYQQSPLPTKFARMFSHILHCINDEHLLITPVEKVRVSIERWPILLVDVVKINQEFHVTSNLDTQFVVSELDIIVTEQEITVRLPRGLTGTLSRACYYRYINEFLTFD
ncbi:DUF1285 domain-containing protein [Shewanella aestuarii]|uniref:DUF1285 domain-containing protein n=1 Tax=Shewanella aestuarii TaxID=1028752 RepID=A0A6G9QL55_9GAMM|nr:DUF1285 domain-containing protein [Shewanella aestuarii]QIR14795.1 DUF1285 domain-containing protein [Shewanella aestuarii]